MKEIVQLLEFAGTWSVLLPALAGVFLFKKLGRSSKIIWVITLLACVPQMVRTVSFMDGYRYAFYNFYLIAEFILSGFFLIEILKKIKVVSKVVIVYATLFFIAFGWFLITKNVSLRFFSECVAISNLMVVNGILLIIYYALSNVEFNLNWKEPDIYFVLGLFFYSPVTVLLYSLWNFLQSHKNSTLNDLWVIHYVANTAMYCLFTFGIFKNYLNASKLLGLLNPIKTSC